MADELIGCIVYIDCGAFGNYQGRLSAMDLKEMTVTLSDAMKNGEKTGKQYVLNSSEIVDLKVLDVSSSGIGMTQKAPKSEIGNEKENEKKLQPKNPQTLNNLRKPKNTRAAGDFPVKIDKAGIDIKKADATSELKILKRENLNFASSSVLPTSVLKAQAQKKKVVKPKVEPESSAEDLSKKSASHTPLPPVSTVEERSNRVTPSPANIPSGLRIDPLSLFTTPSPVSSGCNVAESNVPASSVAPEQAQKSVSPASCIFQKFGDYKQFTQKQEPVPFKLERNNSKRGRTNPSGRPLEDFSNGYGHVHERNRHLNEEIDSEVIHSDFDFEGNNALFPKDELESQNTSELNYEAPADVRNYRNDENVLEDTSRVTSWIAKLSVDASIKSRGKIFTRDGSSSVPVLITTEKKRLLDIAVQHLGEAGLNLLIADRLIYLFCHIQQLESFDVGHVAIVGLKTTSAVMLRQLCVYLSNRGIKTSCLNCVAPGSIPLVEVADVNTVADIDVIFVLDEETMNPDYSSWLVKVGNGSNPARIISLETNVPDCASVYTLYLGALNEQKIKKNKGKITRFVADIGIPFSTFNEDDAQALTEAFSKTLMITL
uniref:DFDF domain-containing protein n=1 Tax=Panagrolaimus sp. JU765 TaxID=591449 RepID=A0AC34QXL5_9BILA